MSRHRACSSVRVWLLVVSQSYCLQHALLGRQRWAAFFERELTVVWPEIFFGMRSEGTPRRAPICWSCSEAWPGRRRQSPLVLSPRPFDRGGVLKVASSLAFLLQYQDELSEAICGFNASSNRYLGLFALHGSLSLLHCFHGVSIASLGPSSGLIRASASSCILFRAQLGAKRAYTQRGLKRESLSKPCCSRQARFETASGRQDDRGGG